MDSQADAVPYFHEDHMMTDDDVGKYEEAIRNYGEDDEMFDVETRREMTEEELYEKFGGYDDDKENLAPFIGLVRRRSV